MQGIKFVAVTICLIVLTSPAFAGKIYKWVDKNGVTHVTNDPATIPHEYRISVKESNPKSAGGASIERIEEGSKRAFDKIRRLAKENMEKILAGVFLIVGLIALVYVLRGYLKLKEKREREKRLRALESSNIDNMDGIEFEDYVSKLLAHRGFKLERIGDPVSLGVDVIAQKNNLKYAVQLNRHNNPISKLAVNDVVAGKHRCGCDKAMVVANSYFTEDAKELAQSTGCELVNRDTLADWIFDFQNSNDKPS